MKERKKKPDKLSDPISRLIDPTQEFFSKVSNFFRRNDRNLIFVFIVRDLEILKKMDADENDLRLAADGGQDAVHVGRCSINLT